jgi:predicted transposase YbfD/YdcC
LRKGLTLEIIDPHAKELGMDAQAPLAFLRFFSDLKDPRRHNVRHLFTDILTIALLGLLCRNEDFDEIVLWARARQSMLQSFLTLPRGIPCAHTFRRLFARLDPAALERCFGEWTRALAGTLDGQVIALDGKALRHSFKHAWDQQLVHMVSAWATENELVLGQWAVDAKSNEITALPRLLDLLNIAGCTITIDAMGTQREIARKIIEKKGHYLLAVKDNQPRLHQKVTSLLNDAVLDGFHGMSYGVCDEVAGGHGRTETRRVWVTDEVQWLGQELLDLWPELRSVAMVEATRVVHGGKTSSERRYYISSHPGTNAQMIGGMIRSHWGIENKVHWQLDMSFDEDQCRLRKDFAAENVSRLRRLALNLLRKMPGKESIKNKRLLCLLRDEYLLNVLNQGS